MNLAETKKKKHAVVNKVPPFVARSECRKLRPFSFLPTTHTHKKNKKTCSSSGGSPGRGQVLRRSDLRQLGGADQRVGLLQEPPAGALVVVVAVVRLGVAVAGTEVVTTSDEKNKQTLIYLDRYIDI